MGQLSVWVPEGSDVIERLEAHLEYGDTRSEGVIEALELAVELYDATDAGKTDMRAQERVQEALQLTEAIDETLDELDLEFNSPVEKRHWITQALRSEARRDSELYGE